MYQDFIERIAVLTRQYYGTEIKPPATKEALAHLLQRTRDELGADLPQQYLDFLRVTDGLNWDGLFLYGSDLNAGAENPAVPASSFVEKNLDWRSYEHWNDYLIFADSDISWYVLNLLTGRYELQDLPSGSVMETFDTFDALVTEALRLCLHEDGKDEEV